MTHPTVNIRLPPELHRRLAALATEGILGKTIEEVVIHLLRNALHRDWGPRPTPQEKQRPPDQRLSFDSASREKEPTPGHGNAPRKRLLRLPEVSHLVGLSKSTIYGMIQRGTFPPPKRLGERSVAWLQSEVESWITGKDDGH